MNSFSLVFTSKAYVALALSVAASLWALMTHLDQLLFFSPVLAFHVPPDAWTNLTLSTIVAALLGVVVSMNVYIFKTSTVRLGKSSFFSGSTLGLISSACAGCTSAGFFLITTFGLAGVAATSFLAQYQLPLRLASIGLLMWALYSANKRLCQSCAINLEGPKERQGGKENEKRL